MFHISLRCVLTFGWFQISDVKKAIETVHGALYPATQQMLIHQGKILSDGSTLEENNVVENSFIVIMLSKVMFFHCRCFGSTVSR